jgi:putative DNA primase/helicase
VTGRDLLHGRHVTHRPFAFKNEAAHVFASNSYPPTNDQTGAFWARWSCIRFRHTRPLHERDRALGEKIIADELPGVLAWALDGANDLAQLGGCFVETRTNADVLNEWRGRTDSVRSWLSDREAVELERDESADGTRQVDDYWTRSQTELHRAYVSWCASARRLPLGLHNFGDQLRNAAAGFGLREDSHLRKFRGVHPNV